MAKSLLQGLKTAVYKELPFSKCVIIRLLRGGVPRGGGSLIFPKVNPNLPPLGTLQVGPNVGSLKNGGTERRSGFLLGLGNFSGDMLVLGESKTSWDKKTDVEMTRDHKLKQNKLNNKHPN